MPRNAHQFPAPGDEFVGKTLKCRVEAVTYSRAGLESVSVDIAWVRDNYSGKPHTRTADAFRRFVRSAIVTLPERPSVWWCCEADFGEHTETCKNR